MISPCWLVILSTADVTVPVISSSWVVTLSTADVFTVTVSVTPPCWVVMVSSVWSEIEPTEVILCKPRDEWVFNVVKSSSPSEDGVVTGTDNVLTTVVPSPSLCCVGIHVSASELSLGVFSRDDVVVLLLPPTDISSATVVVSVSPGLLLVTSIVVGSVVTS